VARIPTQTPETVRTKDARSESAKLADELHSRIPSLSVKITGVAVDSVAVTIDDAPVPTEALAAPRLLDPGSHDVVARSTSGGVAEAKVDLLEGESREVELKIVFTPAAPAAGALPGPTRTAIVDPAGAFSAGPPPAPVARSHALEWALLGAGAGVAAASVVLMVVEAGKTSDASASHDRSAYDDAKTGWTVGLAGLLVGGAAVAVGGVVLVSTSSNARDARASAWLRVGPGDVRIGGTW
jgi:hypothetical protein